MSFIYLFIEFHSSLLNMSSLPIESWETIIKYLRNDKKSLKTIRTVCQGLHALATPLLFSTVRVLPGNDQYNFVAASVTPNLSSLVRRIQFHDGAARPLLHGYPRNDPAELKCLRVLINSCTKDFHDYTDIQERLYDDSWTYEEIKNQKVLEWGPGPAHIAKSVKFKLKGGSIMNMSVFPNLELIETSKAIFLQGPRYVFLEPNTLTLCAWTLPRPFSSSSDFFVKVADTMEAWVSRIELTKLREVLLPREPNGYLPLVPNLTCLTIDLSKTDCWDEDLIRDMDYSAENVLAAWLQDLNGLRSLVIRQNPRLTPAIDIVAMIHTTPDPPELLNTIELDQVTIREDSAYDLVHRHRHSLEQVTIIDPVINGYGWGLAQSWLMDIGSYDYTLEMSREPYKPDNMSREKWERDFCMRGRLIPHQKGQDVPGRS